MSVGPAWGGNSEEAIISGRTLRPAVSCMPLRMFSKWNYKTCILLRVAFSLVNVMPLRAV